MHSIEKGPRKNCETFSIFINKLLLQPVKQCLYKLNVAIAIEKCESLFISNNQRCHSSDNLIILKYIIQRHWSYTQLFFFIHVLSGVSCLPSV